MLIVNVSLYVLRMREDHIFKIFLVLCLQIFYVTGCEPNQRRSTPAITTQTTFKPATTEQSIETSKEYFCEECGEIAGHTITGGREAYPNKYPLCSSACNGTCAFRGGCSGTASALPQRMQLSLLKRYQM